MTEPIHLSTHPDYKYSGKYAGITASLSTGGGGGGGNKVDLETERYLNAKMEAVKAQNDARFTNVLSQLNQISASVPNIWQIAGVGASVVVALVAIAAFAYDRFDGGVSASAIVDNAVSQIIEHQAPIDDQQNQRLDAILGSLEKISAQSQEGNKDGAN